MDPLVRALFFTAALLCWALKALVEAPRVGRSVDLTARGLALAAIPFVWDAWETV